MDTNTRVDDLIEFLVAPRDYYSQQEAARVLGRSTRYIQLPAASASEPRRLTRGRCVHSPRPNHGEDAK